jgi:hypothetical protein
MTDTKMATWWTPLGWHRAPAPQAYRVLIDDESRSIDKDWDAQLEGLGYFSFARTEVQGISADLALTHYRHNGDDKTPPHMLVEMQDVCDGLAQIWVSGEHIDAYFFDKYPDLVAKQRQAESAIQNSKLVKAQIAFIRHGHGNRTIDSYGERTLDDVEQEREAKAWLERAKRKGDAC